MRRAKSSREHEEGECNSRVWPFVISRSSSRLLVLARAEPEAGAGAEAMTGAAPQARRVES